jgi:hypothetical protein
MLNCHFVLLLYCLYLHTEGGRSIVRLLIVFFSIGKSPPGFALHFGASLRRPYPMREPLPLFRCGPPHFVLHRRIKSGCISRLSGPLSSNPIWVMYQIANPTAQHPNKAAPNFTVFN